MVIGFFNYDGSEKLKNDCVNNFNKKNIITYNFNLGDKNSLVNNIETIDIAIVFSSAIIDKVIIKKMKNCKYIVCASVGFDNIDLKYASKKNIKVYNVPDYGSNDIADHAIALLLSYLRNINFYDKKVKENPINNWNPKIGQMMNRIAGMNIGIIGLGRIGSSFALKAKAFDCRVMYYDPYLNDGYDKVYGITKKESLIDLIETSEIISLHVPLTSETENFLTIDLLSKAKNHPIIVNTARGKLITNQTIVNALENNYISAYLSDVLENEPILETDPIYKLLNEPKFSDRIIITPHAASYGKESREEMCTKAIYTAFKAYYENSLKNCINIERGEI